MATQLQNQIRRADFGFKAKCRLTGASWRIARKASAAISPPACSEAMDLKILPIGGSVICWPG
jgi:hypothetical protein